MHFIQILILFRQSSKTLFWIATVFKKVFIWDFISGEIRYFHLSVWSVSYNCLNDTTRNETDCGCYFIAAIFTEMKFRFGSLSCKHYPKWDHTRSHMPLFHQNKIDWFLLDGSFFSDRPRNEFSFHFAHNRK